MTLGVSGSSAAVARGGSIGSGGGSSSNGGGKRRRCLARPPGRRTSRPLGLGRQLGLGAVGGGRRRRLRGGGGGGRAALARDLLDDPLEEELGEHARGGEVVVVGFLDDLVERPASVEEPEQDVDVVGDLGESVGEERVVDDEDAVE